MTLAAFAVPRSSTGLQSTGRGPFGDTPYSMSFVLDHCAVFILEVSHQSVPTRADRAKQSPSLCKLTLSVRDSSCVCAVLQTDVPVRTPGCYMQKCDKKRTGELHPHHLVTSFCLLYMLTISFMRRFPGRAQHYPFTCPKWKLWTQKCLRG